MNEWLNSIQVSAHAIAQFQKRIAPLGEAKTLEVIVSGIQLSENVRVQEDGQSLRVRTRRPFPFEFRAYCVFDESRKHYVVTTIVRGDSKVTRKRKKQPCKLKAEGE